MFTWRAEKDSNPYLADLEFAVLPITPPTHIRALGQNRTAISSMSKRDSNHLTTWAQKSILKSPRTTQDTISGSTGLRLKPSAIAFRSIIDRLRADILSLSTSNKEVSIIAAFLNWWHFQCHHVLFQALSTVYLASSTGCYTLRATLPEQPSTLRVFGWLDSPEGVKHYAIFKHDRQRLCIFS